MRFGRALALPGGVAPRRWHAPASLGLPPHRHRPHARTRAAISLTRHAARSHGPHREDQRRFSGPLGLRGGAIQAEGASPSVPPNRVKSATYRPLTKNAVSDTVVERVETCFVLIFQQLSQATAPLRGRRESPQKWPENPPNGHGTEVGRVLPAPRHGSRAWHQRRKQQERPEGHSSRRVRRYCRR
jgi:hypothetical protein